MYTTLSCVIVLPSRCFRFVSFCVYFIHIKCICSLYKTSLLHIELNCKTKLIFCCQHKHSVVCRVQFSNRTSKNSTNYLPHLYVIHLQPPHDIHTQKHAHIYKLFKLFLFCVEWKVHERVLFLRKYIFFCFFFCHYAALMKLQPYTVECL